MWKLLFVLLLALVAAPLHAEIRNFACDVPSRYLAAEASCLYWTTLNGSIPYATVWPTGDVSVGEGRGRVLTPNYRIGVELLVRAYFDFRSSRSGLNYLEARATEMVINSSAQITPATFAILGSDPVTDGFANIHTRQHRFSIDLTYAVCLYGGCCMKADIYAGIDYLRLTDQLDLDTSEQICDTRCKFEGGGPIAGIRATTSYPFGFGLLGDWSLAAITGRRSYRLETGTEPIFVRGGDVALAYETELKLGGRLHLYYCYVLYKLELGYRMTYAFQAMCRNDLANTGFGEFHGGRSLGFAGPYASLYIAF